MTTTIKDVAKFCDLSVSTVSRALNNKYGVSANTRKIVQDAATHLGYIPSLSARELVNKVSNLVGIIIPESDAEAQPAFFNMLPYLNKTLNVYGKDTIIYAFNPYTYRHGELEELIKKRNLCGCIILPGFMKNHKIFKDVKEMTFPFVVLEVAIQTITCSNVYTDEVYGAFMATNYLINKGHKQIGFINGPKMIEICGERLIGYKKALKSAGISFNDQFVVNSDFTGEGGGKSVLSLLNKQPTLTAVFFANDIMAMGGISTLVNQGYIIPNDLSVIGYDGLFVSRYYNPPLTSIQNDDMKIGIRAAELLCEIIQNEPSSVERIKPEMMIGKTVIEIEN